MQNREVASSGFLSHCRFNVVFKKSMCVRECVCACDITREGAVTKDWAVSGLATAGHEKSDTSGFKVPAAGGFFGV